MKAKTEQRDQARALRLQGKTYDEIVATLGVSKSSVSLWVRDLPKPREKSPEDLARHMDMMRAARDENIRQRIERNRRDGAAMLSGMTDRELLAVGTALYWAEGCKAKPWRPGAKRVSFVNSDPDVIAVYLAWLRGMGVGVDQCMFRVSIHESADVSGAERFWAELVGIRVEGLRRTTLKKHNAATVRYNIGDAYRGCLTVVVRSSTGLYERIEGLWAGIVGSVREDTRSMMG